MTDNTTPTLRSGCGLDLAEEVTCDHCPDPDGCIDYAYQQRESAATQRKIEGSN
jgi:hypothetical protein